MRTVVDTDQVIHLWANKSQDHARNGRNCSFDGETLASYGHYPIARHVTGKKGAAGVLIQANEYSSTTAGQIRGARYAVRHVDNVFTVPHLNTTYHDRNWKYYVDSIGELAKNAAKSRPTSRNGKWCRSDLLERISEANRYAEFFGLKQRYKVKGDDAAIVDACIANAAKIIAEEKRRKAKEAKEAARKARDAIARWIAGESVSIPYAVNEVYLRVQGEEVQTSKGARFPLAHGIKAFQVIASMREQEKPWERNGKSIHLGGFSIDRIEPNGDVKAGCHFVRWSEIERIAKQVGAI